MSVCHIFSMQSTSAPRCQSCVTVFGTMLALDSCHICHSELLQMFCDIFVNVFLIYCKLLFIIREFLDSSLLLKQAGWLIDILSVISLLNVCISSKNNPSLHCPPLMVVFLTTYFSFEVQLPFNFFHTNSSKTPHQTVLILCCTVYYCLCQILCCMACCLLCRYAVRYSAFYADIIIYDMQMFMPTLS